MKNGQSNEHKIINIGQVVSMKNENAFDIEEIVSVNFKGLETEDAEKLFGCVDSGTSKLSNIINKYKITSYKVEASMIPSQADQKYLVKIIATMKGKDLVVEESSNGKVSVCSVYNKANSKMIKKIYADRDKFIDSKRKPYS